MTDELKEKDKSLSIKLSQKFPWDEKKIAIAKALSTGTRTQRDICDEFQIQESTVSRWKQHPEFMQKVNEFTMQGELATRAGIQREINYGIERKRLKIDEDSSTHLQYVKAAAEHTGASAPQAPGGQVIQIFVNQPSEPRRIVNVTPPPPSQSSSEEAEKKEARADSGGA